MAKVLFKRGTTEEIEALPTEDGAFIVDTKTGKTYVDTPERRIQVPGSETPLIGTDGTPSDTNTYHANAINKLIGNISEIVENENGTAIKYSNGIMICYGEFTTLCSSWTASGNTYECSAENPLIFPVEFITRPLSVQVLNTGDKELYRACWIQKAIYTNTGITDLLLGRNTNYSDNFRFSWFAIGKWK